MKKESLTFRLWAAVIVLVGVMALGIGATAQEAPENPDAAGDTKVESEAQDQENSPADEETQLANQEVKEEAAEEQAVVCNAQGMIDILDGGIQFTATGAKIKVHNESTTCTFQVGFASYKVMNNPNTPETQELFDSVLDELTPGETREFTVDVPQCGYTTHFFRGATVPEHPIFELPAYRELDSRNSIGGGVCGGNGEPEPPACNAQGMIDILDGGIQFTNTNATIRVRNTSTTCTFQVGFASYQVMSNPNTPNTQQLYDSMMDNALTPGETREFTVDVPQCGYTTHFFRGADAPEHPIFNLPAYRELDSRNSIGGGVCTVDTECEWDPEAHLSVTNVTINGQGRAQATFTNTSSNSNCVYNVGLTSYEAHVFFNGSNHQEFINNQTVFDDDLRQGAQALHPGQSVTLQVDVPSCNYQVDPYAFKSNPSPVPPDFAVLEQQGTHDLFFPQVLIQNNPGQVCGPQECPLEDPVITTTGTASGSVGQTFAHDIYVQGTHNTPTVNGLPGGLTFNLVSGPSAGGVSLYRISGTPTQAGTFPTTVSVNNECGNDTAGIEITITGQCPVTPPLLAKESDTVTGSVGLPFSYTIQTTQGTAPLVYEIISGILPAGLVHSGTTISGTPTQATDTTVTIRVSNQCGNDTMTLRIVTSSECVLKQPILKNESDGVTGTVGNPLSYTIELIQGDAPLTYEVVSGTLPAGLTLSGNKISGTPTAVTDTIVTIRVKNDCGQDTMTLRIVVTNNQCPVDPALITSSLTASGEVDEDFSYTVTTTGGQPITITVQNLPPGLSYDSGNRTISGTPSQEGTFTTVITATNQCGTDTRNLVITIDDDDCESNCGGGGGGGGSNRRNPRVVLFSEPDINPEVEGAFVSLAQVPYTGVGTSVLQIVLFVLGLMAISGGVAYAIVRRKVKKGQLSFAPVQPYYAQAPFPMQQQQPQYAAPVQKEQYQTIEAIPEDSMMDAYTEYGAPVTSGQKTVAPVVAPKIQKENVSPVAQEKAAFPTNLPVEQVQAKDTPKALPASVHAEQQVPEKKDIPIERLQQEARMSKTLISDEGAQLITVGVETDEKKALDRLTQVIDVAKGRYPREDGWLILDKERVRESLFISILSMVPLFVEWLVRAEDKRIFTFLRMLKYQEQPVADFMRKVVAELDNAHRARLEGIEERRNVDAHIAEVTYHLSNRELENIISEFLHGVDERYDSPYTSVRLSLVRVLDMIKERQLSRVGGVYAFADTVK